MYRYREENFWGKNTFHYMTNMAKPSTRILALEIMNLQFLVSILTLQMLHQGVIRYNTDITSLLICEFNFVKWSEQISVLVHILHFYDLPIYVIDQSYIVKVLVKKKRKDLLDLHVHCNSISPSGEITGSLHLCLSHAVVVSVHDWKLRPCLSHSIVLPNVTLGCPFFLNP